MNGIERIHEVAGAMLEADKAIHDATPVERVLAAYMVFASGLSSLTEQERVQFAEAKKALDAIRPRHHTEQSS